MTASNFHAVGANDINHETTIRGTARIQDNAAIDAGSNPWRAWLQTLASGLVLVSGASGATIPVTNAPAPHTRLVDCLAIGSLIVTPIISALSRITGRASAPLARFLDSDGSISSGVAAAAATSTDDAGLRWTAYLIASPDDPTQNKWTRGGGYAIGYGSGVDAGSNIRFDSALEDALREMIDRWQGFLDASTRTIISIGDTPAGAGFATDDHTKDFWSALSQLCGELDALNETCGQTTWEAIRGGLGAAWQATADFSAKAAKDAGAVAAKVMNAAGEAAGEGLSSFLKGLGLTGAAFAAIIIYLAMYR